MLFIKKKKGVLVTKLSPSGPTIGDYPEADRQEITSWKESCKPIKKNLNASFKNTILGQLLENFAADAAPFPKMANPDCLDATQEGFCL
jgi:hypothetical protein